MQFTISPTDIISYQKLAFHEKRRKNYLLHLSKKYKNQKNILDKINFTIPDLDHHWTEKNPHDVMNKKTVKALFEHIEKFLFQNEKLTIESIEKIDWGNITFDEVFSELQVSAFESGKLIAADYNFNLITEFKGIYEFLQRTYISSHINPFVLQKYSDRELILTRTLCPISEPVCKLHINWLEGLLNGIGFKVQISTNCISADNKTCSFKILLQK